MLKVTDSTIQDAMNEDDAEALQSEVDILSALSHSAITHLREVYDTPKVIYMVRN